MNAMLWGIVHRSIIAPIQRKSVRLLTKAALFILALICLCVVILFLTAAFFIWIYQLAGALIAALAVAGLYLGVAVIAVLAAIYAGNEKPEKSGAARQPRNTQNAGERAGLTEEAPSDEAAARAAAISGAIIPIIQILRDLGLKREEIALLAGAELAKTLPPFTLVGFAIICGFLIGRMAQLPFGIGRK